MRSVLFCCLAVAGLSCADRATGAGEGSASRRISTSDSAVKVQPNAADEVDEKPQIGDAVENEQAEADIEWLVATADATRIVAAEGDTVFTFADGNHRLLIGPEVVAGTGRNDNTDRSVHLSQVDYEFVYWVIDEGGDEIPTARTGIVTTYDGEVVCDLAESIHHVTRRTDGTFVAAVERFSTLDEEYDDSRAESVPVFAVDCVGGAEQPIEPFIVHVSEGRNDVVERVAGKRFTYITDAEGNADLLNEAGLVVNGDDYAGLYAFDEGADRVLYLDYGRSVSPHITRHVVSRATADGELLWRTELDAWTTFHGWTTSAVVVTVSDIDAIVGDLPTVEAIVLDPTDGAVVDRLPTTLRLLHLS